MTDREPPAHGQDCAATGPGDDLATASEPPVPAGRGQGQMWVGPTSEATRRLVAESRLRQGLPARIENPAVIESLALYLRNALATLDTDRPHHGR